MRIAVIAVYNIFSKESIESLSEFAQIDAYFLKRENEVIQPVKNAQINAFNKKSLLSLMRFIFSLQRGQKNSDIKIIHYLNPLFIILIAAEILKQPIVYFCYGGDIKKSGLRRWLLKIALHKISLIFIEQEAQKKYLQSEYQVPDNKIESTLIIWGINNCFRILPEDEITNLRSKWGIFGKYVIFSPRLLVNHYNHHLLLEGINILDKNRKNEIEIVITGVGDEKYIEKILEFAQKNQIRIINLNKFLSPQEMAEIFNISHINVNIPKHDQFGRSIMEGSLCGTIPLLNIKIPTYHDYFKNEINCVYTKIESYDIAEKIEYILDNYERIKVITFKNNINLFQWRQNIQENTALLVERLEELATTYEETTELQDILG